MRADLVAGKIKHESANAVLMDVDCLRLLVESLKLFAKRQMACDDYAGAFDTLGYAIEIEKALKEEE